MLRTVHILRVVRFVAASVVLPQSRRRGAGGVSKVVGTWRETALTIEMRLQSIESLVTYYLWFGVNVNGSAKVRINVSGSF